MASPDSPVLAGPNQPPDHEGTGCHGDPGSLCRRFPADNRETRKALMAVCDSLRKAGLNEDDLGSAELVLAEVLNNIVEHAYCRRSGHVEMTVTLRPDGLYCEVRDHGDHMPQGRPPNLPPPRIDPPRQLPEGGFGWHIIRSLTTHLGYRQQDGWNALSFVMPLTGFD